MPLSPEDKQWIADLLNKKLEQTETRFSERLEKTETNLLTAFHEWARPVEMRLQSHRAVLRTLDVELESLTERVKKLEGAA